MDQARFARGRIRHPFYPLTFFPCAILHAKVIVPIKARTPAPQGKGKDHPLGDYLDNEGNPNSVNGHIGNIHPAHTNGIVVDVPDGEETAQSYLPSPHGGEVSRLEVTDTTRDIPAAELLHLESLVTMGDGQHDSFTCHCWGLEARVWAVNEPGQLVRFTWSHTSPSTPTRLRSTYIRLYYICVQL